MALRRVVAALTASTCLALSIPSTAAVASDGGELDLDVTEFTQAQLDQAASTKVSGDMQTEARDAFLEKQARSGRLVDEHDVNAAMVDGATVVWDDDLDVHKVTIGQYEMDGEDADTEVALQTSIDETAETASTWGTGLGLDVTSGLRGGTRVSGSCVTTTVNKDEATTCFAKYKAKYTTKAYNYYYYERWATGVGRPKTFWELAYTPAIIDIRSRPWKGSSAAAHTKQLNDYWPRAGSIGCKESGSLKYSAAGMEMSVPAQDCESIDPIPNTTTKTMGVIYDQGDWVNGRAKAASFGFTVALDKGYAANMADYTYMKFCRPYVCLNQSGNIRKDAGW